jgi:enterochelin esterase-like enzyme
LHLPFPSKLAFSAILFPSASQQASTASAGLCRTTLLVESGAESAAMSSTGVKHYYIGVGATDFALTGSQNLHKLVQQAGLATSYHETPGPHLYLIWRVFLGDFGSMLFR